MHLGGSQHFRTIAGSGDEHTTAQRSVGTCPGSSSEAAAGLTPTQPRTVTPSPVISHAQGCLPMDRPFLPKVPYLWHSHEEFLKSMEPIFNLRHKLNKRFA